MFSELADVTRPGIGRQPLQCGLGEVAGRAPMTSALALGEVAGQDGDVAPALAQRRERDGEHIEAIEQILAELTLSHHALQVSVGGGDDADIDHNGIGAADALELLLL